MTIAFLLRLFLYLAAMAIPYFHTGVIIDYDLFGLGLYFLLIPLQAASAFFFSPPKRSGREALLVFAGVQLILTIFLSGLGRGTLIYLAAGIWSWGATYALFRFRWRAAAVPELLYLGSIYVRLINFTRGASFPASGPGISQLLLFLGIAAVLSHLLTVMFALRRPNEERGSVKEYLLLAAVVVPLLLAAVLLVPPDFVEHSVVFNQLFEPPEPEYRPLDEEAEGFPGGNLQGRSRLAEERGQNGQPGLYGLPADQWGEGQEEGEGEGQGGRQYAVLVVSSPQDPTYLADGYFEDFDSVRGFGMERQNPLNEIISRRLLETWRNPILPNDRARLDTDIFVLSTIPDRVMAYLPLSAEPTVFDSSVFPFTYSYPHIAAISVTDPYDWLQIRDFSSREREELQEYLEIPLDSASRARFEGYLTELIDDEMSLGQKALAILQGFDEHLYEIGFEEDVSVEAMEYFLFDSMKGDCTEFSNTTAILGRLAGIPTRVVTGYLASSGLQTLSHLQGLLTLQQNIPSLQEEPLEELFLVTTAHRHSWTQFYLPDYGWIDFETTEYAIPPLPGGDPNSQDVVIPLIEDRTVPGTEFSVPWRLIGEAAASLFLISFAFLYLFRYGREAWLRMRIGRGDRQGLLAAERLLLLLLANEGVRLKRRSETPREYSAEIPALERFAEIYDQLRFRSNISRDERSRLTGELTAEIDRVVATKRRPGLKGGLLRIFTLKGLGYR